MRSVPEFISIKRTQHYKGEQSDENRNGIGYGGNPASFCGYLTDRTSGVTVHAAKGGILVVDAGWRHGNAPLDVSLFDLQGGLLLRNSVNDVGRLAVDRGGKGMYIVRVTAPGVLITRRIGLRD